MANMYLNALTALWNAVGTTYSALKMNVTDGGSAADSKLLDLQLDNIAKFTVDKAGNVVTAGSIVAAGTVTSASSGTVNTPLITMPSGGVINWNSGDVTLTHTPNQLLFGGASNGYSFDFNVNPQTNDLASLGTALASWSDLYLASGAVINFANGDITLTHTADTLTVGGGTLVIPSLQIGSGSGTTFTITDTVQGVELGPDLILYRNDTNSAATSGLGDIVFKGRAQTAGLVQDYANIYGRIESANSLNGTGNLHLAVLDSGTMTAKVSITGSNITFNDPILPNKGIGFPAVEIPDSGVNTLDDYKEGTFTPFIIGMSTAGSGTYVTQLGIYTKIGRCVFFTVNLTWTAHSGTGEMRVDNLPYTAANVYFHSVAIVTSTLTTVNTVTQGYVVPSTDQIHIGSSASNVAYVGTNMEPTASVWCSGFYFTV